MKRVSDDFNNPHKVKEWYLGIHVIFEHLQKRYKWNKQEDWDKLEIELINAVGHENFFPDDLDLVKGLLVYDRYPTTEECLRIAQRYPDKTPLLDSLRKLI